MFAPYFLEHQRVLELHLLGCGAICLCRLSAALCCKTNEQQHQRHERLRVIRHVNSSVPLGANGGSRSRHEKAGTQEDSNNMLLLLLLTIIRLFSLIVKLNFMSNLLFLLVVNLKRVGQRRGEANERSERVFSLRADMAAYRYVGHCSDDTNCILSSMTLCVRGLTRAVIHRGMCTCEEF
jgi:hypothetical protein